jgi:hypothetical protein
LPARNEEEFLGVIQSLVTAFQRFVEEQGGWRLLWNDDKTRKPEEAAQLLFKGVVQSYCRSNDIVVDREVELGRGPVDFKFSSGYSRRALLEVKKLDNTKFWQGLRKQLPSYLKSDECRNGWFVALRYDTSPTSDGWAKGLPKEVHQAAKEHHVRLRVHIGGRAAQGISVAALNG